MKKKLSLNELAVKSFKTTETKQVKGGNDPETCICSGDGNCTIRDWYCAGGGTIQMA
ncbi:MAG: hypothetical protein WBB45_15205 [Cyclobacteriaceae bacterium]